MNRSHAASLLLCVVPVLVGCGDLSDQPEISATPRSALLDTMPRIHVNGAGDGAVLRASTVDAGGRRWTSTTRMPELRRDPTRPLWTLRRGNDSFRAPMPSFSVRLDLVEGGRSVARTTLARLAIAPGVRRRDVRGGLYGELFDPPGSRRQPAALVIGGSEGGLNTGDIAALLASRGFPSLALAYFRAPGLPNARSRVSRWSTSPEPFGACAVVRTATRAA